MTAATPERAQEISTDDLARRAVANHFRSLSRDLTNKADEIAHALNAAAEEVERGAAPMTEERARERQCLADIIDAWKVWPGAAVPSATVKAMVLVHEALYRARYISPGDVTPDGEALSAARGGEGTADPLVPDVLVCLYCDTPNGEIHHPFCRVRVGERRLYKPKGSTVDATRAPLPDRQATIAAAIEAGVRALREAGLDGDRDIVSTVVIATLGIVVDAVPGLATAPAPNEDERAQAERWAIAALEARKPAVIEGSLWETLPNESKAAHIAAMLPLVREARSVETDLRKRISEEADFAHRRVQALTVEIDRLRATPAPLTEADARMLAPILAAQSTAWPIYSVLVKLADAAEVLLDFYSCDLHGYEEVMGARDAARAMVAATGIAPERFTERFGVSPERTPRQAPLMEVAAKGAPVSWISFCAQVDGQVGRCSRWAVPGTDRCAKHTSASEVQILPDLAICDDCGQSMETVNDVLPAHLAPSGDPCVWEPERPTLTPAEEDLVIAAIPLQAGLTRDGQRVTTPPTLTHADARAQLLALGHSEDAANGLLRNARTILAKGHAGDPDMPITAESAPKLHAILRGYLAWLRDATPATPPTLTREEAKRTRRECAKCHQWSTYGTGCIGPCVDSAWKGIGWRDPAHDWQDVPHPESGS